jgi:methyl-accepting chemotaxis protein
MLLSLVTASMVYTKRLNDYNRFFLTEVEPRSNALNAMLTSFGYGHAIHNFKNLLIRGQDKNKRDEYHQELQFNQRQFYFALYNYVALVNQNTLINNQFSHSAERLIKAERSALKDIKIIFDRYMAEGDRIKSLYQRIEGVNNSSIIESTDKSVTINDLPAINGMQSLQAGISQLRSEVLNNSHELVEALNILIILSTIILAVFIFTAIVYAFQLLRPLIKLHSLIIAKQSTIEAIQSFEYPHEDEVGNLIKDIQQYVDEKKS